MAASDRFLILASRPTGSTRRGPARARLKRRYSIGRCSSRNYRQGPPPDTANWSHSGANAANTGASQDRFVRAPLTRLWFDGSFRWFRTRGTTEVRVAGGRVLVKWNKLNAIDVFTGRHLWKHDGKQRVGSIALGGGKVFSADFVNRRRG